MQIIESQPAERCEATCHRCAGSFDAMTAPWCDCIVDSRSLACPACGACLCRAGAAAREAFLSAAPARLWARLHAGPSRPLAGVAPPARGRRLAMVVDGTHAVRYIGETVLRRLGFDVISASDGSGALELARSRKPDYLLIDALLPRIDGREVCRVLKEDPATSSMKIAVMTAHYTNPRSMLEVERVFHADDYLVKPVTPDRLRESVEKLLGHAAPDTRREAANRRASA